jgi:hypothetical protein
LSGSDALLNPATVIYFTALVLGRQAGQARSLATSAVFVLAVLAASASWQLLLAVGGSAVGRVLAGPRGRLATALVSSAVIGLRVAVRGAAGLFGYPQWTGRSACPRAGLGTVAVTVPGLSTLAYVPDSGPRRWPMYPKKPRSSWGR